MTQSLAPWLFALSAAGLAASICAIVLPRLPIAWISLLVGVGSSLAAMIVSLPSGTGVYALAEVGGTQVSFHVDPAALWLMVPAELGALGAILVSRQRPALWHGAIATVLLGALGVIGLANGAYLLISWELMSLGTAAAVLSTNRDRLAARAVLGMLGLLEIGSVALIGAVALLAPHLSFTYLHGDWQRLSPTLGVIVALLFLIGFGAKLGLVPFYSWLPDLYGSTDGLTAILMSGVVLNAAFFALARALLRWLPTSRAYAFDVGLAVTAIGVASSVIAALYAFQQHDIRRLASFSTAENAGIAITALGASLTFWSAGKAELAGLCWIVAIIHLMGHSLAKAAILSGGEVKHFGSRTGYSIAQDGVVARNGTGTGIGLLLGAMSLSAMPPTAGFVSEWLLFEALFHDFALNSPAGRFILVLAAVGLALAVAISFASFVKAFGLAFLGRGDLASRRAPAKLRLLVLAAGVANLLLSLTIVFWGSQLSSAIWPDPNSARAFISGLLIVPLSSGFAFISPLEFTAVTAILLIIPLALLLRRKKARPVPPWSGGEPIAWPAGATTSLGFSNALRSVYSFVYRPTTTTERSYLDRGYVLEYLSFRTVETPILGYQLLQRLTRIVRRLARWSSSLQNGSLNAYLAYIGVLFLIALLAAFHR